MLNTAIAIPKCLNIGCGYDKRDGFLNIDSDPATQPDFLVVNNDLSDLPRGYFDHILANDVLEHIPRAEMMGALFDWVDMLAEGGTIHIETSSIYGVIDVMRDAGDFGTIHNWKRCLFGNQVHPGDWHFNGFTEKTLRVYLEAVGLMVGPITVVDKWLLNADATRVKNWWYLEKLVDYPEFVTRAYQALLGREPEAGRIDAAPTAAGSPERLAEIKAIACSDERLYRIGRHVDG